MRTSPKVRSTFISINLEKSFSYFYNYYPMSPNTPCGAALACANMDVADCDRI